jgi:hypothetical protein
MGENMAHSRKLERLDYILGTIGAMMLIVYWLIVATIPDFFFVSISGESSQIRRAELILSTIGWIFTSTLAPLALFLYASGIHKARKLLPYTALVWPISLVISQFTVFIIDGSFYLDYLLKFPVFFYTDLILPIFILFIWKDLGDEITIDQTNLSSPEAN